MADDRITTHHRDQLSRSRIPKYRDSERRRGVEGERFGYRLLCAVTHREEKEGEGR